MTFDTDKLGRKVVGPTLNKPGMAGVILRLSLRHGGGHRLERVLLVAVCPEDAMAHSTDDDAAIQSTARGEQYLRRHRSVFRADRSATH